MTTFLKGDTTAAITLALAEGFDYSNKTVHLEYQGARRAFPGCAAGGSLTFAFSAEETAPMSLGAYPVRVWIEGGGEVLTVHNADVKLRVTDRVSEVHGGGAICLDVRGGLHGIEGLPERYTDEDLRDKVNEILRRLGGTVAALLLCALPAYGAGVVVQTAPKGRIFNDQRIVTNVVFDASGLARTDELPPAPDYSTNNTELVQTVRDTSPAPDLSPAYAGIASVSQSVSEVRQSVAVAAQSATNYTNAALEPYCTIATTQAMTNGVMDEVRGGFLPATAEPFISRYDVGGTVGFSGTVEINGGAYGLVLGEWSDVFCRYDFKTLPDYLDGRETTLSNNLATANAALSDAAIKFTTWLMQFKWDADEQICYRHKVSNGCAYDYAVTNIDLTAVENWPALRAYMEEHEND